MKQKSTFLQWFLLLAIIVLGSGKLNGQLLVENFEYTTGSLLTANGWTAHNGAGTQAVDVTSGLVFDGYAGSGIGGAANLDNNGEDVHRTFEAQTSGAVYVAAVIQTSSTNSAGYFMHLGQATIGSTFFTRLWVNGTGNGVGIGINAPTTYIAITPNTPTLVVLKLDFATKLSSLYVLNSFSGTEPVLANQTFTETASFTNIGSVALRQYHASQRIIVDGIRVATTWALAVAASGPTNPPVVTPTITVSVVDIPAMSAEINQTDAEVFTVSAENLTENITLALSGTNANLFSLSTYSITPTSGTVSNVEVTVTYAPLAAGNHNATLTLSSTGATNVTRNLTAAATGTNPAVPMPNVIITEVYGGGGNSGATLKNDFIELYNTTDESINLGGWSLQYYAPTSTTQSSAANSFFVFPASRFIPAKGHLLIQAAVGTGGTQDLPAPDAISEIALGATGGKIILYTTSLAQTITTDISSITGNANFKDYVPYGTTAVPVWGSATAALTNSTSATRKFTGGNYVYTQNIGNDFEAVTPNPQNAGISTSVDATRLLPVLVVGSQIRFNALAGERVEVYNAMGQQLHAAPATDGMNIVNINARGLMIVKVGELVTKVIM